MGSGGVGLKLDGVIEVAERLGRPIVSVQPAAGHQCREFGVVLCDRRLDDLGAGGLCLLSPFR